MPKPIIYEVAPVAGGWLVRIAGDSQSEAFRDKAEAIGRARQLAARAQGGVRVVTDTGRVEIEYGPPGPGART